MDASAYTEYRRKHVGEKGQNVEGGRDILDPPCRKSPYVEAYLPSTAISSQAPSNLTVGGGIFVENKEHGDKNTYTTPSTMRLLTSSHLPCFLLFLALLQPSLAAKSAATSFCKCICFNNSTIIALNPPPPSRRGAQLHSLDIRSPGAHAGAESESIPDWSSSKRDTDDADDAAAVASSLSSSSPSASAAAASSTTTTGAVIFDDGDDANDHPPPARPHRNRKLSCSDCTRAFCLDYNLPICKEAEEEDVFTTCFRMVPRIVQDPPTH